MEVTFAYSYTQSKIPPRCRIARIVREHDGLVTVGIRHIDANQAPVAIVCRNTDQPDHQPVEYRWFEGRLWTDCTVYCCARDLRAEGGPNSTYRMPDQQISLITDNVTLSHHAQGIYASASKGKEGISGYLQSWAADRIIIDDQLFQPAPEPMYVVMTFGLSNNHGGTSLRCTDFLNSNIKERSYFSLLELQKAEAYALHFADARGDTVKRSVEPGFVFEVLIPAAIQWKNPGKLEAA
ncbi:TPA: hypothetical protein ACP32N_005059 [Pseudomonas aeruginosa]